MNPHSWSIFHDGVITAVSGDIPGNLELTIECLYIREQFPDPGAAFKLYVKGCDHLFFKSFKTDQTVSGIEALAQQDLEILNANLIGDALAVITTSGIITICYQSETMALDAGRALHYTDIVAAANHAVSNLTRQRAPMTIEEFQNHIRDKYSKRDHERGTPATFMWFIEEVGELATALQDVDHKNREEEFADVFAWLCTLANINGVDLNKAIHDKYLKDGGPKGYK